MSPTLRKLLTLQHPAVKHHTRQTPRGAFKNSLHKLDADDAEALSP